MCVREKGEKKQIGKWQYLCVSGKMLCKAYFSSTCKRNHQEMFHWDERVILKESSKIPE